MPYQTIDPNIIKVGDPITKEILNLLKNNLDDHEERLSTLAGGSGKIVFFNDLVVVNSYRPSDLLGAAFFEVPQSCIITEFAIQIFAKGAVTTGALQVDLKKNNSTNPTGFNSVFSAPATVNFATDLDFARKNAVINAAQQSLVAGDILRLDILNLQSGIDKFKIFGIGEF